MARQRIGKSLARALATPQGSGFRAVTRPFAAEAWQSAFRTSAREQAQNPIEALQQELSGVLGRRIDERAPGNELRIQEAGDTFRAIRGPIDVPVNSSAVPSTANLHVKPILGSFEPKRAPPMYPPEALTARRHGADDQEGTGLPGDLKAGIENLSGISMDAVRVHYESARPAQFDALAYAQGTEIHLGPGQEKHLTHEAWHVVQQLQGRAHPTLPAQGGVAINDDAGLENEADVKGKEALRMSGLGRTVGDSSVRMTASAHVTARSRDTSIDPAMGAVRPVTVTGWLGARGGRPLAGQLGRLPGPAVVQRLQDPPVPEKTEWDKNTIPTVKGPIVTDSWLSYKAGSPKPLAGFKPRADPPGYRYIRLCGLTNTWIRFHLVNEFAGGPGSDDNLVPAMQLVNTNAGWKKMETKEKNAWNAGSTYHFAVHVDYHAAHPGPPPLLPGDHWREYFPSKIEAALWTMQAGGWHKDPMFPINTPLPPPNPAQIDYNLTSVSGATVNSLLDTKALGIFMVTNQDLLGTLAMKPTADEFIELLFEAINDANVTEPKRKQLYAEASGVDNLLHDFITGQGTVKLNLK